ncbi:ABC-three component system middle component 7 [Streptococcus suis]|uniref:ABC-three component system middle component 7 n=1 Tax=Streptococcus suis TaxID=1307 RepID=UPI00300F9B66
MLPNKVSSLKESVLGKSLHILKILNQNGPMDIFELFNKVHRYFDTVDEFIEAIVMLFALKKVELKGKTLIYVN